MRGNQKQVVIDDKTITIKELRVKEIIELVENVKEQSEIKEINLFLTPDTFTEITTGKDFASLKIEGLKEKDYIIENGKVKLIDGLVSSPYKITATYSKPLVKILENYCFKFVGLTFEELQEFYPSEIEEVLKAFESVNSPLLRTLSLAGITKESLLGSFKAEIQEKTAAQVA